MNLTKEPIDAIQAGASVRLSDNGTELVVLRADVFDRLRQKAGLDADGPESRILAEIAALPELPKERLLDLAKKRKPLQEWYDEKDDLFEEPPCQSRSVAASSWWNYLIPKERTSSPVRS